MKTVKPECFKEERDDCCDEDCEPVESYVFHEASATGSVMLGGYVR